MSKFVVKAGWKDAGHLTPEAIADMAKAYPPHELEARMNGTPSLGSGAIYPVDPQRFVVDPFELPEYWPRAFGLDVGWSNTACMWLAWDRESDVVYFYSEYKAGNAVPAIHASAIKGRGAWIPGVVDPASAGSSQVDGERLIELYRAEGLDIEPADNSVEAGIYAIWQRLEAGRLKVFSSCTNWLAECQLYRRDAKGKVVKKFDHCQDAGRYGLVSGLERARVQIRKQYQPTRGNRIFAG